MKALTSLLHAGKRLCVWLMNDSSLFLDEVMPGMAMRTGTGILDCELLAVVLRGRCLSRFTAAHTGAAKMAARWRVAAGFPCSAHAAGSTSARVLCSRLRITVPFDTKMVFEVGARRDLVDAAKHVKRGKNYFFGCKDLPCSLLLLLAALISL